MPTKPKPLSGFTYFGKVNKETFKQEMSQMDVKKQYQYVILVGQKWNVLSKEEKEEWCKKSLDAFNKGLY